MNILNILLHIIVVTYGIVIGTTEAAAQCSAKNTIGRLQNDLLCGYNKDIPPLVSQTSVIDVGVFMFLDSLYLDDARNVFEVHAVTLWHWRDEYLRWDPSKYDGIQEMRMAVENIWTPQMTSHTSSKANDPVKKPLGWCFLSKDGILESSYPTKYETYCGTNLALWPFDTQNCTLILYSGPLDTRVHLDFSQYGVMSSLKNRHGSDWRLLGVDTSRVMGRMINGTTPVLHYRFMIHRLWKGHAATVVAPAIVLAVMTLISFWLPLLSGERILLLGTVIMAQCLFLQYLGYKLPPGSNEAPLIVQFFRDSLLMTSITLLLTIAGQRIADVSGEYPSYMRGMMKWLTEFGLIRTATQVDSWLQIMLFLDRLSSLVYCAILTYFIVRFF